MFRPLAAAALLFACPSLAQAVYRWVDAEGTTHYTDNPGAIPSGADVFATEGELISEMGKPGPVPVAPAVAVADPKAAEPGPAIPTSSEQYWRSQFREAHQKVRGLEDELADLRRTEAPGGLAVSTTFSCSPGAVIPGHVGPVRPGRRVSPYQGCMPILSPEYDRAKHRLEKNKRALERAKEDLHELERRASFEAVPLEWRR